MKTKYIYALDGALMGFLLGLAFIIASGVWLLADEHAVIVTDAGHVSVDGCKPICYADAYMNYGKLDEVKVAMESYLIEKAKMQPLETEAELDKVTKQLSITKDAAPPSKAVCDTIKFKADIRRAKESKEKADAKFSSPLLP